MNSFLLEPGLVISRIGEELRLTSHIGNAIEFADLETGEIISIAENQFWEEYVSKKLKIIKSFSSDKEIITFGEAEPIKPSEFIDNLSEKNRANALRKSLYISGLIKRKFTRGKKKYLMEAIKEIAQEIFDKKPPSPTSIHRWWQKFDESNQRMHSLISMNSYRRRKKGIDRESEQFMQDQIEAKYLVKTRPGIASAYRGYLETLELENNSRALSKRPQLTIVSDRTFYERIKVKNKYDVMVARHGKQYADNHFRMIKGHLPSEYPLDVIEVDHTLLDIMVVDDELHLCLGRPWLTTMKDRYSGIIVGFSFSFQKTGVESIAECFKHSMTAHLDVQKRWPDIKNPWPSFGFAQYYEFDRGSDYLAEQCRRMVERTGAHYEYCATRAPWHKASIERFFGTVNETLFETLPGRTFPSLLKRGDYDPEVDSVIKISTFTYLMHLWICDFHNVLPNADNQATPLDLWNAGIKLAPPRYAANLDDIDIMVGKHVEGTLTNEGLRYKWINYASDELSELMRTIGKGQKVEFVINREDLGSAQVKNPITDEYFEVQSTRPEYSSGLSEYQHRYLRKEGGIKLNKKNAINELMKTRRKVDKAVEDSIIGQNKFRRSEAARLAGVNSNSVIEGKNKSINNVFANQHLGTEETSSEALQSPAYVRKKLTWGA